MGLFKQLMIFGKTGLQGLFLSGPLADKGLLGPPPFTGTTWDPVAGSGRAPIPGNISGRSRPRINTQCSRSAVGRPSGQRWILEGGLRVGGPGRSPFWRTPKEFCTVRNCTELGSVTLKRVGLFCFPTKHSTHTPVKPPFWRTLEAFCTVRNSAR
jgi:hypothetical protein